MSERGFRELWAAEREAREAVEAERDRYREALEEIAEYIFVEGEYLADAEHIQSVARAALKEGTLDD